MRRLLRPLKSFPHSTCLARSRRQRQLQVERLEPRMVLDARILITEIVANNDQGLEDEDGERTDWIEIHNAGDRQANLNGWHLTDDAEQRRKWTFPGVTLDPGQFLVVFASGKNRSDIQRPLHTNFQLRSSGEYLGLFPPDDTVAVDEFAPGYPELFADRSYGVRQDSADLTLVNEAASVRVLIPTPENQGDTLGATWTDVAFDDSAWTQGIGGVGFDTGTGYEEIIGLDIESQMSGVNATSFIRYAFNVDNPASYHSLVLRMKYDDGYVAYLNGQELVSRNTLGVPSWDSQASSTHRDTLARIFEDVDISQHLGLLRAGENILAIHGLNAKPSSDDFLVAPELAARAATEIVDDTTRFFERATPGKPNGVETYAGLVAPVTASVERGFYDQAFDVVLETNTPGSTLVYTTDGSSPSPENGTVILAADESTSPTATMRVERTTTLRAAAFEDDFLPSKIATHTYVMLSDVITQDEQTLLDAGFPESWGRRTTPDYGFDPDVIGPNDLFEGEFANQILDSLQAVPSVSIVMNHDDLFGEDGIHTNSTRTGFDWERATSVEFLFPTENEGFQADAGIRIQGDNVRNFGNSKKQSFRLEFRERYGPTKLRYPVFGESATDSFDTIVLRGQYNDGWVHTPASTQYIRDQWARTSLLEMGHPNAHGRFMHVYLNGFYWGMYNVVERPNSSFSASYFGGNKDEWDALNTGAVRDGNGSAWTELRRLSRDVNNPDQQASNAAYLRLLGKNPDGTDNPSFETMLDIDNYIDYLIVNFYGGNVDWPHRNYYVGRLRGPNSTGFKSYAWDTEKILDHGEGSNLSTNRTSVTDGVASAYRFLRANEEFRLQFADHVHRHFFNGGALYVDPDQPAWDPANPQRNVPAARYMELANQVELPLVAESARWGDTQSLSTRRDERIYTVHNWRTKRDNLMERYFPRRSDLVLRQLTQGGLYPELAAPVFSQHGGFFKPGLSLTIDAPGEVYYTLDGTDPRQSALEVGVDQSGVSPHASLYAGPISLEANTVVKARTLAEGQWSALNEATFSLGVPPLRITEIMYHPRDAETGGDDDDFEFVELTNVSDTQTIQLDGIAFTDGIEFAFADESLAPGERGVVVRDEALFRQRYGETIRIVGQYGGTVDDFKLSNGGETLRLDDSLGTIIHEFSYDDAWIPVTDGTGYSLTILDPNSTLDDWGTADAWRSSRIIDGTPGIDDTSDFDGNGNIDVHDVDRLCEAIRSVDVNFDLTADGVVDVADLSQYIEGILNTSIGDADLDGVFDSGDLVRVFQAGEYEDQVDGNSTWAEGDWNCDGEANSSDLVEAFRRLRFIGAARQAQAEGRAHVSANVASAMAERSVDPTHSILQSSADRLAANVRNDSLEDRNRAVLQADQYRDLVFADFDLPLGVASDDVDNLVDSRDTLDGEVQHLDSVSHAFRNSI